MDGDLHTIPKRFQVFWKKLKKDMTWVRLAPRAARSLATCDRSQRAANWMMAKLSGVDAATISALRSKRTAAKSFKKSIVYGELHRSIPALAANHRIKNRGVPSETLSEKAVSPNTESASTIRVFPDLPDVKFLLDYSTMPLHFSALLGLRRRFGNVARPT